MSTRGTKQKPKVPVKPKYPEVIKFSKTTVRMFQEMLQRQTRELNQALNDVYDEIGIINRIRQSGETGEQFELLRGYTGVRITKAGQEKENGKGSSE